MKTDPFTDLLRADESEEHEFLTKLDLPRIARLVCSFLNGQGGRIIVGADDARNVTSIREPDKVAKQVEEHLRQHVVPIADWSATVEGSNSGESILVIDVPLGTRKPYLIDGQIWSRRRGETLPASPDDVSGLIQDRIRADERWERRVALGIRDEDLDLEEVLRAAQQIEEVGRHKFAKPRDPILILNELSLFTSEHFTNAAVVLFGKQPCAVHPQTATRLTVYETGKTGTRFIFDKEIELHLFATLERLTDEIFKRAGVSSRFENDDWQRRDTPTYPLKSVREGVLNALIHRDLSSPSANTTIGVYADHILISNFGELPKGWRPSVLKRDHSSVRRNPDIAHVCFLRGFVEKLGRGTQLIVDEFSSAGLKVPVWKSRDGFTTLMLFNKQMRKVAHGEMNQRQMQLVKELATGQEITVSDYLTWWIGDDKITERTARADFAGLVDGGFLEKLGRARSTRYKRTSELI